MVKQVFFLVCELFFILFLSIVMENEKDIETRRWYSPIPRKFTQPDYYICQYMSWGEISQNETWYVDKE